MLVIHVVTIINDLEYKFKLHTWMYLYTNYDSCSMDVFIS